MSQVKAIQLEDVHRICSGQVITSLPTAVKELVENALDSKPASRVEVRLGNYGFDSFEVVDDGPGIALEDRASVCLKHFTSKLAKFEDLVEVSTFGFRGEALSSLCETCGSVTITTRCLGEEQGAKLTYDRLGVLQSSTLTARAQTGTSVLVRGLFDFLPVRRMDLERKLKRHYTDLLLLLQAYALITTGRIRFFVTNVVNSVRSNAISTQGADLQTNIAGVFGLSFLQELVRVDFEFTLATKPSKGAATRWFSDSASTPREEEEDSEISVRMVGFVSKPNSKSVGTADRQFFYVNGRPVEMKKFAKAANEVWKLASSSIGESGKPACVLDLVLPLDGSFDVNLSPDKREVFVANESGVLERFKQCLTELWAPTESRMLDTQTVASGQRGKHEDIKDQTLVEEEEEEALLPLKRGRVEEDETKPASGGLDIEQEEQQPIEEEEEQQPIEEKEQQPIEEDEQQPIEEDEQQPIEEEYKVLSIAKEAIVQPIRAKAIEEEEELVPKRFKQSSILDFKFDLNKPRTATAAAVENKKEDPCCDHAHEDVVVVVSDNNHDSVEEEEEEDEVRPVEASFTMNFGSAQDLVRAERDWEVSVAARCTSAQPTSSNTFTAANIAQAPTSSQQPDQQQVEQVLEGQFLKSYFGQAEIIGQFNLGFIIARVKGDLFILDQHASDEKYRFEALQHSTTIHEQPLIVPLVIDATAVERQIIRDYEYVFNANGFRFTEREGVLLLTTLPHSKRTTFGAADVRELAALVRENPPIDSQSVLLRPSKLRAMFASRACRSAVMIGNALTTQQMSKIVANLETLDQPWNCPHGRPTLRHLVHLADLL